MKNVMLFLLLIILQPKLSAQYCTPTFTNTPCGCCTSNGGDVIANFWTTGGITDISNLSTGCGNGSSQDYTYYSGMTLSQSPGHTFVLHVQSSSFNYQGFRVWIDYNNDFDFDDLNEDVWNSGSYGNALFTSTAIQIPFGVTPGLKRMRVMSHSGAVPLANSSCIPNTSNGECEDYDVMVIQTAACSGQPSAGNVLTSQNNPCFGMPFVLSLSGVQDSGLSYQWLQSHTGMAGSWTPIIGATFPTFSTPGIFNDTCFCCAVTCNNSNLSDTSGSMCFNPGYYSPMTACYCPATHTGGSTNCILDVNLSGVNNYTGDCSGGSNYILYGSPIMYTVYGQAQTLSVITSAPSITSVWIDYNHSASFDPSEWIQVGSNTSNASCTFVVPLTALPGLTRMRVRSNIAGGGNGSSEACTTFSNGETEDYLVSIGMVTSTETITGPSIAVYPNPTKDVFNISGGEGLDKQLYNVLGQLILSTTSNQLMVGNIQEGLYFLACQGRMYKVVVEK